MNILHLFLSSVLGLEVFALDHHDLAHAVIFIVVAKVLDRVGPEAMTEGSLAHLSTRLEVPRLDPGNMEATVVGSSLWWVVWNNTHLGLASLSAMVRVIGGTIREIEQCVHIIISGPSSVHFLEVKHLILDVPLLVSLSKRLLKSRNVS